MSKRNYPLILIDDRRDEKYPYDFVTVLDDTVGFVARVVSFFDEQRYREALEVYKKSENAKNLFLQKDFKNGGLVLEVLEFFDSELEFTSKNSQRIRSLLKRAMKKYLFGAMESSVKPDDELGIDNQIIQQKLTIQRAKSNYSELLRRAEGNRDLADFQIKIAEATLRTLESSKRLQELNLN